MAYNIVTWTIRVPSFTISSSTFLAFLKSKPQRTQRECSTEYHKDILLYEFFVFLNVFVQWIPLECEIGMLNCRSRDLCVMLWVRLNSTPF